MSKQSTSGKGRASGSAQGKTQASARQSNSSKATDGVKEGHLSQPRSKGRESEAVPVWPTNGAKTHMLSFGSYLRFFWAGLAKRSQTGSIVPSQRFLVGKMIEPVPPQYRGTLIELGAGSGALTLRLAARCPAARVLAFEINPTLAEDNRRHLAAAGLQRRVEVVVAPAENLPAELARRGLPAPDFILSGIPLGNLAKRKVIALVDVINQSLAQGGMYIQFQYSLVDRRKIKSRFPTFRTVPAFLNFPPAFVYYARK